MEYLRLGGTGLKVSRLALGCMSYGDPATPRAHDRHRRDGPEVAAPCDLGGAADAPRNECTA